MVSLNAEAEQEGLSVDDRIKLGNQFLRQWMATRIVWTFVGGNVLTLIALAGVSWLDQTNIEHRLIAPGDRVINHQVIMTLLGATALQVGTIAVIIARYLFPDRSRDGP